MVSTCLFSHMTLSKLTKVFSKKLENHAHVIALHFLYYNFVRIHKMLRRRPRWRLV
jgi:hypothetical protein